MAGKRTPKVETPTANTFTAESRNGMEFTYEETEAPAVTVKRETKANPHTAGVAKAVEFYKADEESKTDKPRALAISVPTVDVKTHTSWLRRAGNDADVTVLVFPSEAPAKDGVEHTRLTFRAVKKITRVRKPSATETTLTDPTGAASPEAAKF